MLVLTRKAQEKIQIGDNITITVLRTKGKAVRLGIEAPGSIAVLRGELAAREAAPDEQPAPAAEAAPSSCGVHASPTAPRNPAWQVAPQRSDNVVSMQRVSRSRVGSVLPQMLGDSGPLRAMLDRRTAASQV